MRTIGTTPARALATAAALAVGSYSFAAAATNSRRARRTPKAYQLRTSAKRLAPLAIGIATGVVAKLGGAAAGIDVPVEAVGPTAYVTTNAIIAAQLHSPEKKLARLRGYTDIFRTVLADSRVPAAEREAFLAKLDAYEARCLASTQSPRGRVTRGAAFTIGLLASSVTGGYFEWAVSQALAGGAGGNVVANVAGVLIAPQHFKEGRRLSAELKQLIRRYE